jgi:NADH:ubiquinone oxidoreductase subunit 3 (subunit A)
MSHDWRRALGLAAALILVQLAMVLIDLRVAPGSLFADAAPIYTAYFAIRMVAAVLLATGAAIAVFFWNPALLASRHDPPAPRFSFAIAAACVAGTVAATLVLVGDPALFYRLAREDSVFEWTSALLLFAGSIMMLVASSRLIGQGGHSVGVVALLLSLLLFLTAMEEISWLQRQIGFATPEVLQQRNEQGEANVHNLATGLSENIYYAGAYLLVVFGPSLAFLFAPRGPLASFARLLPSRYALLAGALSTGFCYEMWNVFWLQFAFFYAVLLLGGIAGESFRIGRWRDGLLFSCAGVALVACHLIVLGAGNTMVRPWDDSEFKELLIAAGLFLHASEVFGRVGKEVQRLGGLSREKA